MVLDEKPIQQLEARSGRDCPAHADLRAVMADLWVDVVPAVSSEYSFIDLDVQLAKANDRLVAYGRVIYLVIKLREAESSADHHVPPLGIELFTELVQ